MLGASKFYFRPCALSLSTRSSIGQRTQKEHKSWNCVVYTPNKLAELAFNQFGNEIKLLDAIYKTIRCDLLLFFPVAKTNINCIGLGSFIIQSETTTAICTRTVNNLPWLGWYSETLIFFDRLLPRENKCKKETFTGRE